MSKQSQVHELLNEISSNLSQKSSSRKDEIAVMQMMLSDTDYEVSVYGKDGVKGAYKPAEDFKSMCSSVMSHTAKISVDEAEKLMSEYVPSKKEAEKMVNILKEFVNTFLQTGRKLPLGGRENSEVSLSLKKVGPITRSYPQKVGVNDDGTDRYSKTPTSIPAHESIRVHSSCPPWINK